MTDQQLIDALVKRVQEQAAVVSARAGWLCGLGVVQMAGALGPHANDAADLRDLVAHLAGLLDMPTPERRAAALAALDLPQETR